MNRLLENQQIRYPGDLRKILRLLRQLVEDGAFDQVLPDYQGSIERMSLFDVSIDGPWPDYIELQFVAKESSQRYRLAVETYHGAGGVWRLEK